MGNGHAITNLGDVKPHTSEPGKFGKFFRFLVKLKAKEYHKPFGKKWDKRARHRLREIAKEYGAELKDISRIDFLKNRPKGEREMVVLTFSGVTYSLFENKSVDAMTKKIIEKINTVLEREKKKFRYIEDCVCHDLGTTLELKLRWEKANGNHA